MHQHANISGIHHITAVASSAAENALFYQMVLGLNLVKKTVNFDDPFTYHLYYGDSVGSPGTILTFFPWEKLPPGRPGAGMITAVAFAIPRSSIRHWYKHLMARGFTPELDERFGDPLLRFRDPHGLPLELVGVGPPPTTGFGKHRPISPVHAIFGLHSATMVLNDPAGTQVLLSDILGMRRIGREKSRHRFGMSRDSHAGCFLDMVVDPAAVPGRPGGGTVHHIAFRTADDTKQKTWQRRLRENGYAVTGVRDRKYFRSIYFNEPGGALFEIATDPPGFTVDETPEKLGQALKLPSRYEPIRSEIEKRLPSLIYRQTLHPQTVNKAESP
jgi:glyoxalase family protein